MRISFWIPGALRPLAGGLSQVDVEPSGGTLEDALDALFAIYPGIRDRILTERREIREHVNVFVGNDIARATGGLATPVTDRAEIWIIPAISGG
jgi:sulfur-carrier protein